MARSFWRAMIKTWQELASTRENKPTTTMFMKVVMEPSLVRFIMATIGHSNMLRGWFGSGHLQ